MSEIIGAHHEFHDQKFVEGWAERFVPTQERLKLFNCILHELQMKVSLNGCVVELGLGPGYLADHLLRQMPGILYYGIDFSSPMLDIARARLRQHLPRVAYVQGDLVRDDWWTDIPTSIAAIVSTWSLHDLGSQESVEAVYKSCARLLQDGGVFLNGDFVKPEKATQEYEAGRFEIPRHIEMLHRVGFKDAKCLVVLEEELESPTAAQNYACFKGVI